MPSYLVGQFYMWMMENSIVMVSLLSPDNGLSHLWVLLKDCLVSTAEAFVNFGGRCCPTLLAMIFL